MERWGIARALRVGGALALVGGLLGCAEVPSATLTIVNDLARPATYSPCDDWGCDQADAIVVAPGARSEENLGDAGADYVVRIRGNGRRLCLHVAERSRPHDVVLRMSSAKPCR